MDAKVGQNSFCWRAIGLPFDVAAAQVECEANRVSRAKGVGRGRNGRGTCGNLRNLIQPPTPDGILFPVVPNKIFSDRMDFV